MQLSKLFLISVSFLALVGCATTEPTVRVVTQRVEVMIAIPCKEVAPPVPDYCFSKITEGTDIFDKTKCLLSDRQLSLGYEVELLAKLNACK